MVIIIIIIYPSIMYITKIQNPCFSLIYSEYTWSSWKYVTKDNEVATASLYHHFHDIVKKKLYGDSNAFQEGKNDANIETKGCSEEVNANDGKLIIYAAVYGLADVTDIARNKINHKTQSLTIQAINSIFSDSWGGIKKTLIIVWGIRRNGQNDKIKTTIIREGESVTINEKNFKSKFIPRNDYGKLNVLSAVYGLQDHSEMVQSKVKATNLNIKASNGVFGDSWPGIKKSLVVVYRIGAANSKNIMDSIRIKIVQEGQMLNI